MRRILEDEGGLPQSDQVVALIAAAVILLEQIKTALGIWCVLTDDTRKEGQAIHILMEVEKQTHLWSFTRVS